MDVVANARAVGSRVVGAEDLGGLPAREAVQHHGDEIEGGHVSQVVPAGAGDVEVPQAGPAQPPGPLAVRHHPLADQLGLAIGVDGMAVDVLGHDLHRRHAVDGGRGGEDHLIDPHPLHRQQHVRQAADVLLVVPAGPCHRLAHLLARREMDDRRDAAALHDARERFHRLAGRHVQLDHLSALHASRRAVGQVIDDDHLVPALKQKTDDVGSDVAGTAGNENTHGSMLQRLAQARARRRPRRHTRPH